MSSGAQARGRIVAWSATLLVAFLLSVFSLAVWLNSAAPPAIEIGYETTRILAPLQPDGMPDYATYLHSLVNEGVTSENNAARLVCEVIQPDDLDAADVERLHALLGISHEPAPANRLLSVDSDEFQRQFAVWLAAQGWDTNLAVELMQQIRDRPWAAGHLQFVSDWVSRNQWPLDQLVEASRRSGYSASYLFGLSNGSIRPLSWTLLPGTDSMRAATNSLRTRAMWHASEGQAQDAWQDLLAAFRLNRFACQGHFLIEYLVGVACDRGTCQSTQAMLHHTRLSPEVARQIYHDLCELPDLPSMATCLEGERLMDLDMIVHLARGTMELDELLQTGEERPAFWGWGRIDWNPIMREINQAYDFRIATAKFPDRNARRVAFQQFDAEVHARATRSRELPRNAVSNLHRESRQQNVADWLVARLLPSMDSVSQYSDEAQTHLALTRVAAALAVYRAESGEYPDDLQQLVPGIMAEVPVDPFSFARAPLIYCKKADGYLLYSVYRNRRDDQGRDLYNEIVNGEWTGDEAFVGDDQTDVVVRVPVPALTLRPPVDDAISDGIEVEGSEAIEEDRSDGSEDDVGTQL